MRQVDAFIALQADEPRAQHAGHHLRSLGLTDARLAFDEEGLGELQGEEDRRRKAAIADVLALAKPLLDVLDRGRRRSGHAQRLREVARREAPGHPMPSSRLVRSLAWSAPPPGASCTP